MVTAALLAWGILTGFLLTVEYEDRGLFLLTIPVAFIKIY
jgi:hypothetical protein